MAITAAIALSDATILSRQSSVATVTISNSGGADVRLLSIVPKATAQGGLTTQSTSLRLGVAPVGPAFESVIPAGGNLKVSFSVTPISPWTDGGTYVAMPSQQIYTIGATLRTSEGADVEASTASLTVSDPFD